MTATLLDANVLIAAIYEQHDHHAQASEWFEQHASEFSTNAITQGAFVRFLLRLGAHSDDAIQQLDLITTHARHEFWPADFAFAGPMLQGVIGHRQVTDAYLAEMARVRDAKLATFDLGLAAAHPDVAELIPT